MWLSDANLTFILISVTVIPLYMLMMSRILKNGRRSFRSTFYSAVLGMIIVDICAICLNFFCLSLTEFEMAKDFFWNSRRSYLSVFCYAQLFYFVFTKAFAHVLLAGERFTHNFLKGTLFYKTVAPSFLMVFSFSAWIPAFVIAWHIFIQSDISFSDRETLHLIVPSTEFNFYMALYLLSAANVIILVLDLMIIAANISTEIPRQQRYQDAIQLLSSIPLMLQLAYLCYHGYNSNINQSIFAVDSLFYVLCGISNSIFAPLLLFDEKIRNALFKQADIE